MLFPTSTQKIPVGFILLPNTRKIWHTMLFDLELDILRVNYGGDLTLSTLHTAGAVEIFVILMVLVVILVSEKSDMSSVIIHARPGRILSTPC